MTEPHSPSPLATSVARFKAFFKEINQHFTEREEVLLQVTLALLSRQHLLMTGPPGTAKSGLAGAVLGRIRCDVSGRSSLFARQFTENTVQTDLVGPIDFKTLTETGRTVHFTDEGILGAHHAFLDEVFDGRDMLLRSTLNLLQEREFKQGGHIATGHIECAFMTSNRYIAEILDTSRETLLAFLDRIAFVSFIPRGFTSEANRRKVVRTHGGGFGKGKMRASLSIQDLDLLQAAADLVYLPEPICDLTADFIADLDQELYEARRADPRFQPTRYMSTRTMINATNILRAIALCDKIFHRPQRALQVEVQDLAWLRYTLILSGVSREDLAQRIETERDPRERLQLETMRTEMEVFERCLKRLPTPDVPRSPRTLDMDTLNEVLTQTHKAQEPDALQRATHALQRAFDDGAKDAREAARHLLDEVSIHTEKALRAGLAESSGRPEGVLALTARLTDLATDLERVAGPHRALNQWLRQRLTDHVDETVALSSLPSPESIQTVLSGASAEQLHERVEGLLGDLERLHAMRRDLGAEQEGLDQREGWQKGLRHAQDELALLMDARLRHTAADILQMARSQPLSDLLSQLEPAGREMTQTRRRLERLGLDEVDIEERVLGARVEPIISKVMLSLSVRDRRALIEEIKAILNKLEVVSLGGAISPTRFVEWVVPALIADEGRHLSAPKVRHQEGFKAARDSEASLSLTETLLEIAVCALPEEARRAQPEATADAVRGILRALPEEQRETIAHLDIGRVDRSINYLTDWWATMTAAHERKDRADGGVRLLEAVVSSGFLRVLRNEREAARLASEAQHIGEVFTDMQDSVEDLQRRIRKIDDDATKLLVGLLQRHSDQAWEHTLKGRQGS